MLHRWPSRAAAKRRSRAVAASAVCGLLLVTGGKPAATAAATQPVVAAPATISLEPTATWTPAPAHWVWLPGDEKPANGFVQFRKTFSLTAVPARAVMHASADCKYLFWINGVVVGRGPVVTDPKYKQVDVYDVRQFLKPGTNVIAALVLQRHNKTSRLWPVRGGFLLQLDADQTVLGTDPTWKSRWAVEYKSDTPYMTHQYGQQEWYDARLAPGQWVEAAFDDRQWSNAVPVTEAGLFWPAALELRSVPHMLREVMHPKRLVSYFGVASATSKEPARQIEIDYPTMSILVKGEDNLAHPEQGPVFFQENTTKGIGFVVDLGEEMLGYPFIEFECPAGVTVDLGHGEVLSRNRIQTVMLAESPAEQRYADRYFTRGGRQRWEIFDTKGCRYLEIHFRSIPRDARGARVIIHEVGFIRSRAPVEQKTEFSCSDELMNRIFEICRRTAEVKFQDWHIADAQREQNQWLELYQDMLFAQTYGRCELLRQTIQNFARAQMPSGFIPSTLPSIAPEAPTPQNQYIFSTYAFPMIVYVDWLYGGQDPRQAAWLNTCAKVFDGLFAYLGPDGVLTNTPGSHWVEWSALDARPGDVGRSVKRSWEVTFYSAFLVLTLERMADMAQAEDRSDLAQAWRERATKLRRAAGRRYWSEARQAYIDGIYEGAPSDTVSQTTGAMAVLARLGEPPRLRTALDTVADPQRCDVPSAINSMALYHEALESLDQDRAVPDRIRSKWKKMLDLGATTTWEQEQALERANGCCFAFGAHPLNYMVRNFLGVVPLEPGYRRFSVRLAPHDLTSGRGKVATPHGMIEVAWTRSEKQMTIELTVPEGCEAVVTSPRMPNRAQPTDLRLDDRAVSLASEPVALGTFLRETRPAFRVGAGRHTVTITF